ncbi:ecdysteroid 22-kinase family protein [Novosphingobium sp. G106]|uniref:phosphotransferase n=1 Tax=Novosphingobium sp. G106 TaxID=2849500 RepID=UPI001C2CC9B1|nr:phosphotransferase [Novosphingobium sp. G106]MBV1688956.1 ecdysteroid 22-kinase family protein [Novosphingobium sp. G106]
MTSIQIPSSLDEIDAAFIGGLLRQVHPDAELTDIAIEGEIHGTATKARLVLTYKQAGGAPPVVWMKAGYEPHSSMLASDGIYALEPRVYQELLPILPVTAPRYHGAIFDERAGSGVVLIEDLGPTATLNTPRSDVSVDEVSAMLSMLAKTHAATAAPGWLEARPWIQPNFADFGEPDSYLTYMAAPATLEQYLALPRAKEYPPEMFNPSALHAAIQKVSDWARKPRQLCMIHGDAHVGNSYVTAGGQPGLLDWQCVRRSGWAYDVTYYMVSALSTETRRNSERDLLRGYLDELAKAGGPAPSWDEAWEDYLICLAYGFVAWLTNSTTFQPEDFNGIISTRFAWAMVDHGTMGKL